MHETFKSVPTVFPHYTITTSYWQVSAMTHLASNWLNAGVVSRRWGTAHPSIVPYQVHCMFGQMTNDKNICKFDKNIC